MLTLDQLKDAGVSLPEEADFSGTVMVGWNEQNPTRVYIAAAITDDTMQDFNDAQGKWYNDDCIELIFDLSDNNIAEQLTKWVIGATGKDLSVLATTENTEYKIVKEGSTYYYEMAIDLSKLDDEVVRSNSNFELSADKIIGFSIAYNDGENKVREHQIGWTSGKSSDRATFGNLQFVADTVK